MAHRFKKRQYEEVRDQAYTLITFKDGKRLLTYSGLSMPHLVHEIMKSNGRGYVLLVFKEGDIKGSACNSWELDWFLENCKEKIVEYQQSWYKE